MVAEAEAEFGVGGGEDEGVRLHCFAVNENEFRDDSNYLCQT